MELLISIGAAVVGILVLALVLKALWRVAELAHPNRPLQRGYARVEDRNGKTLTSAAAARAAGRLRLVFGDGAVAAAVAESRSRASRGTFAAPASEQPKLL